jgi:hypothetical protein
MTYQEHGMKWGYVYFLGHGELVKIGGSADPNTRYREFRPRYPGLVLVH